MVKILANDGIHPYGKLLLEEAKYQVDTERIPQDQLVERLPEYDAVIVRSATKIRKELIDACPNLKMIARAGVGMDNIDVQYAREKGIQVINTPAASSRSVAELVVGHLLVLGRSLHMANREMPVGGITQFKALKKRFSKGLELGGKTLGIIGFGRIGQELAKIALGMGMDVVTTDLLEREVQINIGTPRVNNATFAIKLKTTSLDEVLAKSDFISVHIPFSGGESPINAAAIEKMKDGVLLVNTSRGGVIDEDALIAALDSGKVAGAALDVFVGEPTPREDILTHPKISLSPHIGASTIEAQRNIGLELADAFIEFFGTEG
ncbi:MAG: D-2-hydroxyacid dehydrogenase [Saprospiraceae bacterium]|nr:D-2-hydroxyacid dehydrogenase [Saprospiraceae bacterium]